MTPRPELRIMLRERRRALSRAQRRQSAAELARRVSALRAFRCARHIAFYLPHDGEMELAALLARALRYGKRCYLPVLCRRNRLAFAPYRTGDRLSPNRFGIPEPALPRNGWPRNGWTQAAMLDLILMPLVAFDARGNRLGMGAGFYDRTLGFLKQRRHWRRPRLMGVAYDFQCVPDITPAPWDVALDSIVTEKNTYHTPRV